MKSSDIAEKFITVGIDLSNIQAEQFKIYYDEILAWNLRAKLISKKDESRIVERHFLESSLLSFFEEFQKDAWVLDLGTGGGFPGVPLVILNRSLHLTLLDSKRWKTLFLKDLIAKLQIQVEIVYGRAEDVGLQELFFQKFDVTVSRAVTQLDNLFKLAIPFLRPKGKLITLKGSNLINELDLLNRA